MILVNRYLYFQDLSTERWKAGWYFSDETEDLVGPFPTKEEAEAALKAYGDWLGTGPSILADS